MKIIHLEDGVEFMRIQDGKVHFDNKYIHAGFKNQGIAIPPDLTATYNGKDIVFLDDPEFEKAFRELYFAFEMDKSKYRIVEES